MNSLKTIFDYDTWQEIFGSVAKNKTRTVITVIGVLWGIFIYITLSGSAKGLDNGFDREFDLGLTSTVRCGGIGGISNLSQPNTMAVLHHVRFEIVNTRSLTLVE